MQLLPSVEMPQGRPGGPGRGGHRMEVGGPLPPWVLDRLCKVLQESQDGQFTACAESSLTAADVYD